MPLNELPAFMAAIAKQESEGMGGYEAVGPETAYGRGLGKWQMMSDFFPGWAREAGIPGADWRDPQAQEHVARHKMTQYYNRYGRWDLVAVAWFAGPGRANVAEEQGIEAVGSLSDVLGTTVAEYVRTAQSSMGAGQREGGGGRTEGTGPTSPMATAGSNQAAPYSTTGIQPPDPAQEFVDQRRTSSDTMASIMSFISDSVSRNEGGRVLDTGALFGDIFGSDREDEPEEATAGRIA